jgi:hypothetical protein
MRPTHLSAVNTYAFLRVLQRLHLVTPLSMVVAIEGVFRRTR